MSQITEIKKNLKNSFLRVKLDTNRLWNHISLVSAKINSLATKAELNDVKLVQLDIEARLKRLEDSQHNIVQSLSALLAIKGHKLVLNKVNHKLHLGTCGFIHRIKPEHRAFFDSVDEVDESYVRCSCMKE